MTLPGVGRKTANVVLNVAFGHPTLAVDTHIFRVANRTGLAKGKTPDEVEEKLLKVIPSAYLQDAHHWLLLHGRYCCKARRPECERCPVAEFCSAPERRGSSKRSEQNATFHTQIFGFFLILWKKLCLSRSMKLRHDRGAVGIPFLLPQH